MRMIINITNRQNDLNIYIVQNFQNRSEQVNGS